MQTIGKHAGEAHRGDFIATCAYCGAAWYRSALRRNASGQLICPDDRHIRDPVTLSRLNAQRSSKLTKRAVDGGLADVKPAPSVPAIVGASNVVAGWEATEASVTLAAGGRVSAWAAQSGGFQLVQSNTARQPKLKQDGPSGRRYVSFEGAHRLDESTTVFARPSLIDEPTFYWAVARQARASGTSIWWAFKPVGASLAVLGVPSTFVGQFAGSIVNSVSLQIGRFKRIEASFTGGAADYFKAGVNSAAGSEAGNDPATSNFSVGAVDIVGDLANTSYLDLCELWVLRTVPSTAALTSLDALANSKYGSDVIL